MNKQEMYKAVVQIQKATGQGMSGLVRIQHANVIDQLVAEGKIIEYNDGNSFGHPDSSKWYCPADGYNCWKDDGLDFVRFYLNCLEENESGDETYNMIHPTAERLRKDPDFMIKYAKWLKKNKEDLEIMDNLSEILIDDSVLPQEYFDYIKRFFGEPETVGYLKTCIEDRNTLLKENISLLKRIIELRNMKEPSEENINDILDKEKDVKECQEETSKLEYISLYITKYDDNTKFSEVT
jgi:hypothetical protein